MSEKTSKWIFVRYGLLKPEIRHDALADSSEESVDHDTLVLIPKEKLTEMCSQ